MNKPSLKELSAFKDLSPTEQKAYLKRHPKSKFRAGYKPSAGAKHNAAVRGHATAALAAGRRALRHATLATMHAKAGNTARAAQHTKLMEKHSAAFDKHSNNAESTHHKKKDLHKLSKRNTRRFAMFNNLNTKIGKQVKMANNATGRRLARKDSNKK